MYEPIKNNVLVKPDPAETQTPGGIFIPATADEDSRTGVVVAVGPGSWVDGKRAPLQVKPGDRVHWGRYSHQEVGIKGVKHYVMTEDAIMGILARG